MKSDQFVWGLGAGVAGVFGVAAACFATGGAELQFCSSWGWGAAGGFGDGCARSLTGDGFGTTGGFAAATDWSGEGVPGTNPGTFVMSTGAAPGAGDAGRGAGAAIGAVVGAATGRWPLATGFGRGAAGAVSACTTPTGLRSLGGFGGRIDVPGTPPGTFAGSGSPGGVALQ